MKPARILRQQQVLHLAISQRFFAGIAVAIGMIAKTVCNSWDC